MARFVRCTLVETGSINRSGDMGGYMLKALLHSVPSIRQAMLLREHGAPEVATADAAVSPEFAVEQKRAFDALGERFGLGALKSAISGDQEVSLSFHRTKGATLAIVSAPRVDRIGERLADLDARTENLR